MVHGVPGRFSHDFDRFLIRKVRKTSSGAPGQFSYEFDGFLIRKVSKN